MLPLPAEPQPGMTWAERQARESAVELNSRRSPKRATNGNDVTSGNGVKNGIDVA